MDLRRFNALPRRADDEWQGGVVRLPSGVERGPGGRPYRPWAGFWISRNTGFVHLKVEPAPGTHDWTLALETLLEFAAQRHLTGYRPGRLQVCDRDLGARLIEAIGDPELGLTVLSDLPAVRKALSTMAEQLAGGPLPPGALDADGVTVDRMRAFAQAADAFYRAAPWRYLSDEDLIHVEAPSIKRGLRHVTILGAAGQTFGLGFFDSAEDYAEVQEQDDPTDFIGRSRWSVFYGPISELPHGDADLWEDHALPAAGDQAYPIAIQFNPRGSPRRPDAATLSYLEGLLRALAGSDEDEIDRGRWTRDVTTYDGPVTYRLCIPPLLEPYDAPPKAGPAPLRDRRAMERVMVEVERFVAASEFTSLEEANEAIHRRFTGFTDTIPSTGSTPLEKAKEIAYRAFQARGRRRIQLARKALETSADCADAYVILAEQSDDASQAHDLYARGVAAGERALGPGAFQEHAGRFWEALATRPYMRARFGLAQCLNDLGRQDDALGHYRELLRLNPNDNQGVRYNLLAALLAAGLDDESGLLLDRFKDEPTASWLYGRALWAYRRGGDSPDARAAVRCAVKANRRVLKYLGGKTKLPPSDPPSYSLGSEEEAVICARELANAWRATPGAVEWLRTAARAKTPRTRRRT